jgi:cobalt-zinc-cadmium efflux system protein
MTQAHALNHQPAASGRLTAALIITLAFVAVETVAGLRANSLALVTDAAHNVTDVIALGLTWYALRLANRPASPNKTYGYHRAGILVALLNAVGLILIALVIFYEAYQRLRAPVEVQAGVLTVTGMAALAVNLGTAWLVAHGRDRDLGLRSAFVHLAADAAASLGAVLAGIGILLTGLTALDAAVSVLISLLIVYSAWGIVRETVDILLEGTPADVDMLAMVRDLQRISGVRGVHDLHVWSINQQVRALSAHILVDDVSISAGSTIQSQINRMLQDRYGIAHATLQLECAGCEPDQLFCELEE